MTEMVSSNRWPYFRMFLLGNKLVLIFGLKICQALNSKFSSLGAKIYKNEFTRGPCRGDTCHHSVFDETLPG